MTVPAQLSEELNDNTNEDDLIRAKQKKEANKVFWSAYRQSVLAKEFGDDVFVPNNSAEIMAVDCSSVEEVHAVAPMKTKANKVMLNTIQLHVQKSKTVLSEITTANNASNYLLKFAKRLIINPTEERSDHYGSGCGSNHADMTEQPLKYVLKSSTNPTEEPANEPTEVMQEAKESCVPELRLIAEDDRLAAEDEVLEGDVMHEIEHNEDIPTKDSPTGVPTEVTPIKIPTKDNVIFEGDIMQETKHKDILLPLNQLKIGNTHVSKKKEKKKEKKKKERKKSSLRIHGTPHNLLKFAEEILFKPTEDSSDQYEGESGSNNKVYLPVQK